MLEMSETCARFYHGVRLACVRRTALSLSKHWHSRIDHRYAIIPRIQASEP